MLSANNIEIIPVFQITFEIFPKHYNILGNFLVARIFDPPKVSKIISQLVVNSMLNAHELVSFSII